MNPYVIVTAPVLLAFVGIPLSVKLPETHPIMVRADKAYTMALEAAELEYPELPKAARVEKANFVWKWSLFESVWDEHALGDCIDPKKRTIDTCRSLGVMQVMNPERYGFSRGDVVKDGVIGYRVGMKILRLSVATCGNFLSGLGMYASGSCGFALPMVKNRCKQMGYSSTCEEK